MYGEEKYFYTGPTRAAKAEQKSLILTLYRSGVVLVRICWSKKKKEEQDLTYNASEGDGGAQVHVVFFPACKLKEHFHIKFVVHSVKVAYDCPIKRLKQFCREVLHYK